LFSKGDKVITVSGGKFGERWAEIARAYGLDVIEMQVQWGTSPDPLEVEKIIKENKGVKGLFTTLCETSTATVYDIEALGRLTAGTDILFVVDAISGMGQDKLLTDKWNVDVVVSGSQKGFMLPPGLACLSVSEKARKAMETSDLPKYYFNLKKALKSYAKDDTPWTPAVSLIIGMQVALEMILNDGLENRWDQFNLMAKAARAAAEAIGLKVYSQRPSDSVTAIVMPDDIKSGDIVKTLRTQEGMSIAGGQGDLKNRIIRIAHMGWINQQDLIECFSLLEKVLYQQGYKFELGASLKKIQEVIYG
jgi:aspartate aminotransferase-like enzyme